MKPNKILISISIFLIVLGILSIIFDQLSYTRYEELIDIGPLEALVEKEAHCYRLPVIFGILVIISGICIIALEIKKNYGKKL